MDDPAFEYPDKPMDRGKILWEEDLEKIKGEWGRYLDVDGDGIPYRTVPGNHHPRAAYFARGTGHDEYARYSEEPDVWEKNMATVGPEIRNGAVACPRTSAENKLKELVWGNWIWLQRPCDRRSSSYSPRRKYPVRLLTVESNSFYSTGERLHFLT